MKTKILVVDDEPGIRKGYRTLLADETYTFDEAADGPELMRKLNISEYNVIIMECHLAHADGFETISTIKSLYPNIPMVISSRYATLDLCVKVIKLGAFDFHAKPWDIERLRKSVKAAVVENVRRCG